MDNVSNANSIQNNLLTLIVAETTKEKNDCYQNIISCYMVEENGASEDIEPVCINDPENLIILVDSINRDIMTKEKMLQAKLLNVLSWLLSCIWVHEINNRLLLNNPYSFVDTHPELYNILMKLEFSIKEIINYFSEHSKLVDMHTMDPIIILTLFMLEKQLVPSLFQPHINTIIPIISTIISSQDILRIPENISQMSQSAPLPVKKWIMGFKTLNNLTALYGKEKGLDAISIEVVEKSIFNESNGVFLEYLFHCVVHIVTAGSIITNNSTNNSNIGSNVDNISSILSAVSSEDQQMVLRVAVRILINAPLTTSIKPTNTSSNSNLSNTVDITSTTALLNVVSLAHDNVAGICEYISSAIKNASQLRKTSNNNLNNLPTTESINNEEWSVSAAGAEENSNPESDKNNAIRMCCDLWRLLVSVLGQMMCVENYIPASGNNNINNHSNSNCEYNNGDNNKISSSSSCSDMFLRVNSAEKGKAMFVKLITPSSGVGVLAAPLQGILKVSRVLAAECYLSLASVLVLNEEWFSPSAPLKLLLRLLHNILFTPLPSSSNTQSKQNKLSKKLTKKQTVVGGGVPSEVASATVSSAQNTNVTNTTISAKQKLANDEHVKSIEIAGQALCILCAHIPRSRMNDVLNISIPITTPSAAKTNSPAATSAATTTGITTATAIESNKISIQLIINKLQSINVISTTTANNNTDSIFVRDTRKSITAQCVSALFANDLKYLQGSSTTQQATSTVNVHKENVVLLEKGLFSQDKLFTRVNKNNNNSNNAIGCNEALSRLLILSGVFESLATVTAINNNGGSNNSHANQNNNNNSNTDNINSNNINNSSTAVDNCSDSNGSNGCSSVVTNLTISWQLAVLTLTQSLFTELATLASNQLGTQQQNTQNNTQNTQNMYGGAVPVYQYTQFDSQPFSLFSQQLNYNTSGVSGNSDGNLGESPSKGNPLPAGVAAAASKKRKLDKQAHDSFLSDSEPDASPDISFVDTYLPPSVTSPHKIPRHNNNSSNSSNKNNNTSSSSGSDNAQFVLCSAYPPAVEITIKLFKIAIKIWTIFWDPNNNHAISSARTMFLESLFWFLHRTTGFNCDLSEECRAEFSTLSDRILKGCGVNCTLCPRNAVGCLLLLTILHTNCDAATSTTATSISDTNIQSLFDSHKPLYRALRRSINSMTESATLPPLLEWIPSVLAVHCVGDSGCNRLNSSSGGNSNSSCVSTEVLCATITVNNSNRNSNCDISDSSVNKNINKHLNSSLTIFLSRFLRESLQQLSAMILPSPSEQQDEDLVRSMANGLRNLLICPIIYMISNNQLGMKYLFGSSSVGNSGGSTGPLDTLVKKHSGGNVGSDNAVLGNWRKLFTLFLTLEDVRQSHTSAGNSAGNSNNSSNNVNNSSGDWLCGVFTTLNDISSVPFTAPTADSSNLIEYFNTLQLNLQLISTAAEVTIAHKNRHNQHNNQQNNNTSKSNNIHAVLQYLRILLVNVLSGVQVAATAIVNSSQGTDSSSVQMMDAVSDLLDVTLPLIQKLSQNRISSGGADVLVNISYNININNKTSGSNIKAQYFQAVIVSIVFNILAALLAQVDLTYKTQMFGSNSASKDCSSDNSNSATFKSTEKQYDSVRKWIYSALTVHSTIYSQLKNTTSNSTKPNNSNNSSSVKSIMSELQIVLHVFATTITPLVAVPISSLTTSAVILKHNKANYALFEYINTALVECGVAKIVPPEVSAVSSYVPGSTTSSSVVDLTEMPNSVATAVATAATAATTATTATATPSKIETSTTATTSTISNSSTKIFDSASKRSFISVDSANTTNSNSTDNNSTDNNNYNRNNSAVKRPRDNNITPNITNNSNSSSSNINKQLFPRTRDEEQPDAKYLKLGTLSESELVRLGKRAMGEPSQSQSQSQQPASPQQTSQQQQPFPQQYEAPQPTALEQLSSQPQADPQQELDSVAPEAEEKEIVAEPETTEKEVPEVVPSDQEDVSMEVVEEGGDVELETSVSAAAAAMETGVDTQVIAAEITNTSTPITATIAPITAGSIVHSTDSHCSVSSAASSSSALPPAAQPAVLGDKMVRTATDQMIERLNTHELFPGNTFNMPDSVILPDTPPDYMSPLNITAILKPVPAGVASMAATNTAPTLSAPTTTSSVLKRSLLPPLSSLPSLLSPPPLLSPLLQPLPLPQHLQSPMGSVIVVNSQSSQSSHQSQSQPAMDSQQSQHQDSQQLDSQELESQSVLDLHDVPELSPSAVAGADVVVDHSQGSGLEIGSEGFADVANVLLTLSGSINKSGNIGNVGGVGVIISSDVDVVVVESTPAAQLQSTATASMAVVVEALATDELRSKELSQLGNDEEHNVDINNITGSDKSVLIDSQATVAEDVDSQDKLTRNDSLHSHIAEVEPRSDAELTTKVTSSEVEPSAIRNKMEVDADNTAEHIHVQEVGTVAVATAQNELQTSQQQASQPSQVEHQDTLSRRSTAGSFSFATPRTTQQAEALLRGILRDHHDDLAADSAGEMMMHRQATTQYSDSFLQIGPSGSEKSQNNVGLTALASSGTHDIAVKSGNNTAAEVTAIANASGNEPTGTIPDPSVIAISTNNVDMLSAAEEEQEDVDMHIADSDELPVEEQSEESEASDESRESYHNNNNSDEEGGAEKSANGSVSDKKDKVVENIAIGPAVWMEDDDNEAEEIDRETVAAVDNNLFQTFVSQFEEREQRAAAASRQKAAQQKAHLQGNFNTNSNNNNSSSSSGSSNCNEKSSTLPDVNVNSTTATTSPSSVALSALLHSLNSTLAEAVTTIAQHTQHTQHTHPTTTSQQNFAAIGSQQGGRNISSEDREAVARAWHKTHELNKLLFDLMQRK